jgi:hypothetical protein
VDVSWRSMDDIINENGDHEDEHVSFNDDVGMNQDEEDPDDRINGMVEELYTVEDQDKRKYTRGDETRTLSWCNLYKIFVCGEVASY